MLFAFASVLIVSISSWVGAAGANGPDKTAAGPTLRSAGPLAFGEGGVLFIGDTTGSAIYAVDTRDVKRSKTRAINCDLNVDNRIGELFNVPTKHILVNDLSVNPLSGNVYVSVSILREKRIVPAVVRVAHGGTITSVPLAEAVFLKTVPRTPNTNFGNGGGIARAMHRTIKPGYSAFPR